MLFKYFSLSGIFGKKFNVFEKTHGKITSFPDSIFRNYRNIEEIYLNCNCIKTIPKDISYLTKLRILNLAENDIMYIPAEIAKLQHLSELDIKKNDILSLPLEFENLCNLTYLDLSSNKFNNFPLGLMKLTRLIYLNLNDTGINIIPSTIKNLIYLKSLEMRDNCIEIIPSELSTLAKLEIFDVSANLISVLPMNIGKLKQLDEFWVDCCELTSLPESIGEMIKITHFSCCENLLISLSQSFTDLYNIVDLNLSQNSLCSLPIDIGNLINLVIFKVDDNQISVLPDSICKCNQLTELILTHNTFKQLPQQFGKLKKLYNLNVDMNELTSLPDSMCDCENLSILSVRRNLIKCLPEKIGQLQNLIVLDVSSNCLNHLPISLTNCHPKAIWLNENQSKSLIKLETEFNETENAVVVTCCLLPQVRNEFDTTNALSRSSASDDSASSLSVISETEQNVNIEQKVNHSVVNFNELPKKTKQNSLSRQNTPHPKELREAQTRLIRESKMSEVKNKSTSTNVREKYEIELIHSPIVQTINAENPIDSGISSNQLKNSFDSTSSLNTNNASVEIVSVYTKKADLSFIMPENAGLGISISGGVGSMPYFDNDHSIFISDVEQNGYAEYFGLQKNDKILYVNNNSFNNISHNDAVDILSNLRSVVSMCVERKVVNNKPTKINNHTFKTATIKCNEYQQFGFKAISSADCHVYPFGPKNSGIYISKIYADESIIKSHIFLGDSVIKLNELDVSDYSQADFEDLLASDDKCSLVCKSIKNINIISFDVDTSQNKIFGLIICGEKKTIGSPRESYDNGIFVDYIDPLGIFGNSKLKPGYRLIEINSHCLLKCCVDSIPDIFINSGKIISIVACIYPMISQDKIELVFVDVDNIINGSILSNSISYSEGKKTYNKKYTVLGDKTEEISINSVQELNLDDTQNIIV